ncbi:MAG: hypothetical protein HQK87_01050 [Nitrospinae bacterium]|nr:hypothetical protein [Nitrospinota bacterium]
MMKILPLLLALLLPATAQAADKEAKPPMRENRVVYDLYRTEQSYEDFRLHFPQFTGGEPVSWGEFNAPTATPGIWAPAPQEVHVPSLPSKHMKVRLVSTDERCDSASRALFLIDADGKERLYAYVYHACDRSGLLTSAGIQTQYLYKYGMYDEKIFDREMILYRNVRDRYRVGVAPWNSPDGAAGVAITVIDDTLFSSTLTSWKVLIKRTYEQAQAML